MKKGLKYRPPWSEITQKGNFRSTCVKVWQTISRSADALSANCTLKIYTLFLKTNTLGFPHGFLETTKFLFHWWLGAIDQSYLFTWDSGQKTVDFWGPLICWLLHTGIAEPAPKDRAEGHAAFFKIKLTKKLSKYLILQGRTCKSCHQVHNVTDYSISKSKRTV